MTDEWPSSKLGELLELAVSTVQVHPSQQYPIVGVLNRGRGVLRRAPIWGSETKYRQLHRVDRGMVLYSKLKAFEGAVTVALDGRFPAFASPEFPTFRCGTRLSPEYFALVTQLPAFWSELSLRSTGMGGRRERVSPSQFLDIALPTPPLEVQQRIVDLIGAIDAHASNLEGETRAQKSAWEAMVAEIDTLGGRARLGDHLDRITAGKSPPGEDRRPAPGERAVLKVSAVGRGEFRPDEVKVVPTTTDLPESIAVGQGDVLMVRANGVLERVGQVCQVDGNHLGLFLCDKTLRLEPRAPLDATYMAHALLSPASRQQIERLATGSDMRNIAQSAIREITIPVPEPEVQTELVGQLAAAGDLVRTAQKEYESLHALRSTLLRALLGREAGIPETYDVLLDAGVA